MVEEAKLYIAQIVVCTYEMNEFEWALHKCCSWWYIHFLNYSFYNGLHTKMKNITVIETQRTRRKAAAQISKTIFLASYLLQNTTCSLDYVC